MRQLKQPSPAEFFAGMATGLTVALWIVVKALG
jgi:hypothetical protein